MPGPLRGGASELRTFVWEESIYVCAQYREKASSPKEKPLVSVLNLWAGKAAQGAGSEILPLFILDIFLLLVYSVKRCCVLL